MKLGLKEKIEKLIAAYKANCKTQGDAIKTVLEPFKVPSYANRFTQEGLAAEIKESMDGILSDWKKYDKALNDQVATVIASAKKEIMDALHVNKVVKKPSDYAIRIANAREFMKDELADVTDGMDAKQIAKLDSALAMILKDFMDDYDTMKLFSKMVEKKVILIGATGECSLPKTFGKMMKIDSIMNTLNEVDECATMLFLHARTNVDEVIRIKGAVYGVPVDGYGEQVDEENIIDNASILDALADEIDSEGQSKTTDEGTKNETEGQFTDGQDFDADGHPYTATHSPTDTVEEEE